MANSHSTATPEATKTSVIAHPPVPDVQKASQPKIDRSGMVGTRAIQAIGRGSPETPPEQYAWALGQLSGRSQTSLLRQLQRSYGNSYVGRVIQAKLTVNQPGDIYEQEADRMAAQVMTIAAPQSDHSIQREIEPKKEKEKIQMMPSLQLAADGNREVGENLENQLNSSKGGGSPLPNEVRSFMEPRFGADLSQVRVHTGGEAVQMNWELGAQAFTHGSDVYFGAGKSPGNNELTAHELTHVVQQTGAVQRQAVVEQEMVSHSMIQRDESNKGNKGDSIAISLLEKNRPGVETARANALVRVGKIAKLQSDGSRVIGSLKTRLMQVAERYDQAYQKYAEVIAAAKQEARDQQDMMDLVVGIAIGVTVGLALEAAGAAALFEAGGVAAKALGKWGAKAAGEATGEGVEALGGKGGKATGITEVAGKDLQPDGLKPEVLRMQIWKALTKLHESLSKAAQGSLDQTLLMGTAEYAIGEIKSQKGGGADMTAEEDVELVLAVISADKGSQGLDKALDQASQKFAALKSGVTAMPSYDVKQMEKDIWILWMSSLSKDSNILDIDAIEDYLGPKGLGLVDFGIYTSDSDENEAIEKAKKQATEVRNRRLTAVNARGAGPWIY
jgi:hypothetical protein